MTMNIKEATRAIRLTKYIFAWVQITDDDGLYVQVTKSHIRNQLELMALKAKKNEYDLNLNFVIRDNEADSIYIN